MTKQKINYTYPIILIVVSFLFQLFIAVGHLYIANKNTGIINTDDIDKFISEQKLKDGSESEQKPLKLSEISREIDLQTKILLKHQNDTMKYGAIVLVLSGFLQIIALVDIIKTNKKITRILTRTV